MSNAFRVKYDEEKKEWVEVTDENDLEEIQIEGVGRKKFEFTRAEFKSPNGEVFEFLYAPNNHVLLYVFATLEQMEAEGWKYLGEERE